MASQPSAMKIDAKRGRAIRRERLTSGLYPLQRQLSHRFVTVWRCLECPSLYESIVVTGRPFRQWHAGARRALSVWVGAEKSPDQVIERARSVGRANGRFRKRRRSQSLTHTASQRRTENARVGTH
jgi:hypothetical protein